jgi:hypothetical protein
MWEVDFPDVPESSLYPVFSVGEDGNRARIGGLQTTGNTHQIQGDNFSVSIVWSSTDRRIADVGYTHGTQTLTEQRYQAITAKRRKNTSTTRWTGDEKLAPIASVTPPAAANLYVVGSTSPVNQADSTQARATLHHHLEGGHFPWRLTIMEHQESSASDEFDWPRSYQFYPDGRTYGIPDGVRVVNDSFGSIDEGDEWLRLLNNLTEGYVTFFDWNHGSSESQRLPNETMARTVIDGARLLFEVIRRPELHGIVVSVRCAANAFWSSALKRAGVMVASKLKRATGDDERKHWEKVLEMSNLAIVVPSDGCSPVLGCKFWSMSPDATVSKTETEAVGDPSPSPITVSPSPSPSVEGDSHTKKASSGGRYTRTGDSA